MSVMDVLMKPLDWAIEAESDAVSFLRMGGVLTGVVGAVVAPILLSAHFNGNALANDIAAIDAGANRAFSSIERCVDAGQSQESCQASWKKAAHYIGNIGTSISYSSSGACARTHGTCDSYRYSTTTMVGKVPVTNWHTAYRPHVAGWQTSSDLQKSVPLYTTPASGIGIRNDGARIGLN